eukprot:m.262296 g.262296  ORF g.262296 m.262296 type:complete len:256 (-) comp16003_c0_seq2:140-907(-)
MMLASIQETDLFQPTGGFGMTSTRRGSLRGELYGLYIEPTASKIPSLADDEMSTLFDAMEPSVPMDTVPEVPASPPSLLFDEEALESSEGLVPSLPPVADIDDILAAASSGSEDDEHEHDEETQNILSELVSASPVSAYDEDPTPSPSPNSPPPRQAVVTPSPPSAPAEVTAAPKRRRSAPARSKAAKGGAKRKKPESAQRVRKRDGNRRAAKKFREKQKIHEMTLLESVDQLERSHESILAQLALVREIIAERQ